MKIKFLSLQFITFPLFLFAILGSSSCNKGEDDPYLNALNQIKGEWEVTSYIGGNFEEEQIQRFLEFKMIFDEYGTDEGKFRWPHTYESGTSRTYEGIYKMNDEGNSIRLTYTSHNLSESVFNFRIVGNQIKMAGFIQWEQIVFIAEK